MSNPSKQKGTAAETLVVRWFRDNGFPQAERIALNGNKDKGDVGLCPGVIIEVKNVALAKSSGLPTQSQLTEWMRQAQVERINSGATLAPLIVKRAGTRDVGRWLAYLSTISFADLIGMPGKMPWHELGPVMVDVSTLLLMLRAAGYGEPLSSYGREGVA